MTQPAAAVLDLSMMHRLGVTVEGEFADAATLPVVTNPVQELGGRCLLKYIREADAVRYSSLSGISVFPGPHFLTPTPLHLTEVQAVLNLPPLESPVRVLLLLPEKLSNLRGPRRIIGGQTIEYVCDEFTIDAIASPQWGILL